MNEYEELRIRLCEVGRNRYLVVANGPSAAAAVTRIERDNGFRASFERLLDEEFRRVERAEPSVHQRVRELGERLFGVLFPEPVAACLFESARRAEEHRRSLRVRFELPPGLADLPVEVLCPPLPYRRLAGDSRFSLTRSLPGVGLSPSRLPTPSSRPSRFRVLVVVAEPQDGSLDLGAEVSALQETMSRGAHPAAVVTEMLGWAPERKRRTRPTLANLRAALGRHTEMPAAVVVLGHGTGGDGTRAGRFFLENKDGSPDPITGDRLAAELAAAQNVRLVVLNLCAGAEAAPAAAAVADELIAGGVPAVVAMQADVSNVAAARFTPSLFTALATNGSLDEAVLQARNDMVNALDDTTMEWATPVLSLHQQCRHTWLFKAVKVVNQGVVPDDPLARGHQATSDVDDPTDGVVRLESLVEASRFARLRGDWNQVVRYADMGRDDHPEPLEWLAQEGRLELVADRFKMIGELLAGQNDVTAAETVLDGMRYSLPDQVFDCVATEVQVAAKAATALRAAEQAAEECDWKSVIAYCDEITADLPDGYRDALGLRARAFDEQNLAVLFERACEHRDAGDWAAAVAAFDAVVHTRPDGYRDAGPWRAYCHGRVRESVKDMPGAIAAYVSAGDVADASGREALCRGHQADGAWAEAVEFYETAVERGVDAGLALPYARGRAAGERADFAAAAKIFHELPDQYRDVRVHVRFADGRVAFDAGQWRAVLDALHLLPPGFQHGEVSRMRGLARARIAEEHTDWQAVVEALHGLEDDDEIALLRAIALGWAAAARNDYRAIVEAYRLIPPPTEELADLLGYAVGRVAEEDGDLAAALEAYLRVPDGVKDVVSRRDLVRGRMAEDAGDWPEAERWFAGLPADYAESGLRAGYAGVRAALDREDWAAAADAAEALNGYRDAKALARYGRARVAESTEDWEAAAELYTGCNYDDADVRLGYARARALEANGRWDEALESYEQLSDEHADVPARRALLAELMASFGWTRGMGEASLVPDPSAEAGEDFPYRVLAPLGIGPDASMPEIKDAEMRAMRENVTVAIGVAATLRSWDKRLPVDADLYPIRDAEALRRAFGTLTRGEPADLFERLCAAAPADAPLLTLLHVGREQAIAAWEELLRADPADTVTAHCLAIAHRWAARDLDRAEAWEHGRQAWQRCIGMWVTTLGDEDYWGRWRQERSRCYHFMVPVKEIEALRLRMLDHLTDELHRAAEKHGQDGRPALAAHYRALGLTVRVERLGRDVLAELAQRTTVAGVLGGPAFQRVAGLSEALARLAADLVRRADREPSEEDDDAVPADLVMRLCAAFSRLAPARALLEDGRPERALAMLPDRPKASFATVNRSCGCTGEVCETCRAFLDTDPAYTYLGGREARLWQDSARIAVKCHVDVARAAVMGDEESGVDVAVRSIRTALEVAGGAGLGARARREIAELVDASVEALTPPGAGRVQRPRRAVELVERVREIHGLRTDDLLRRAHAEALYQRAQATMLEIVDFTFDYDQAIDDLRLAIERNPAMMMARAGLAHTLVQRSMDRPWAGGHAVALAEALTVLTEGLRSAPGMIQLLEALETAADQVRAVIYGTMTPDELMRIEPGEHRPDEPRSATAVRLARSALAAESAGDLTTALLLAVDAVAADTKEIFAQRTLTELVRRWAANKSDGSTP